MPPDKSGEKISRTVSRKSELRRYLLDRDMPALEELARGRKNILRTLSSSLYDSEPLVRWRAIEALGKVAGVIYLTDPEKIRRQIRRILWLMNDESGGICWKGPEAVGEIIFNNPVLVEEYGSILLSYLNEEPFEAGTRNAVSRVARIAPEIFAAGVPVIIDSLKSENPSIRGFSVKALTALEDGSVVLCDRFSDATVAYQSFGRDLPLDQIRRANRLATGGLEPDLTLWLDLVPDLGLERARSRNDREGQVAAEGRFEAESRAFHQRVRRGYRSLWESCGERIVRIESDGDEEYVSARIQEAVLGRLERAFGGTL